METKFQTSFIPKKSAGSEVYSYKKPLGAFLAIGICIAILSVVFAGGTFVYKSILSREAATKEADLEQRYNALQTNDINNLVRFGDKLDSGQKLLDSHLAVTPIFSLLQNATLKRLQFTELTYTYLATNKIAVAMKGVARDFGVVARQSDAFAEAAGGKFIGPIFTNLNTDERSNATFSFLTTVDPSLILYKNYVNNQVNNFNQTQTGSSSAATSTSI